MAIGSLCAETGLTHTEVGQMDARRVQGLLVVNQAKLDFFREREAQEWSRN